MLREWGVVSLFGIGGILKLFGLFLLNNEQSTKTGSHKMNVWKKEAYYDFEFEL